MDPLDPRSALYGGRTETMARLLESQGPDRRRRKIRYVDVCSLYPYICKYGQYPLGHPTIYVGDECSQITGRDNDISNVNGFIKCTVLPPRNLYHPVLPVRMHNRLLFPLCRSCAEEQRADDCNHEVEAEREFHGVWVACELKKALELNYTIKNISEIWQYEVTRYSDATGLGGLFAEYMNTFLKLKQEASGWPDHCRSEEAKREYIRRYELHEKIKLDYDKIEYNPALRQLAKLVLNTLWGKFSQRENLTKTEVVFSRERFFDLLTSPTIEIKGFLPVNDDTVYVSWVYRRESAMPSPFTSVAIAAFTTAQAHLRLYEYIQKLQERAIYCDTDSCVYYSEGRRDEYEPPTGDYLGDLTDELACYGPESSIVSFASGGPKFYAYIVRNRKGVETEVCKIKGITLNHATRNLVNHAWLRQYILANEHNPMTIEQDVIRRTTFYDVYSASEEKQCKPVYAKRWFVSHELSYPFGYRR